jgi:hypothetical protein
VRWYSCDDDDDDDDDNNNNNVIHVLGFVLNNLYFNILRKKIAQLHGVIFQTNGVPSQSLFMFLTLATRPIKITADPKFGNSSLLLMCDFEQPCCTKL